MKRNMECMSTTNVNPCNILVVEDDSSIRETIKDILESEGYHVFTAVNGKDGLEKVHRIPKPCLVLLDMMMPVMSGQEFINNVSSDVMLAPIPILIFSAHYDEITNKGVKAIIKKPADINVLLRLVAQYSAATTHGHGVNA
ncbi:MAG: response regulator [Bdellovibrionota bacterium]